MFDLIILGGGPAGCAAAVYAARKKLKTLIITKEWGGQSVVSAEIFNWIGTPSISGSDLAKAMRTHVEQIGKDDVTIISGKEIKNLERGEGSHTVLLSDNSRHTARAILIATGSGRRRLEVPGADRLEHKGLTYCATCDGPLFTDMDVIVIGGGNAGFESAAQLLAYCKSVTLLHRSDRYRADEVTVEKVLAHPKMRGILNATPTEVFGEKFVEGIRYTDKAGETHTLNVQGIFVEIGIVPNTNYVQNILTLDTLGRIEIDPWTQKTSVPGIWAAGDCTNVRYHQNNISAGDGVKALEDIYTTLMTT